MDEESLPLPLAWWRDLTEPLPNRDSSADNAERYRLRPTAMMQIDVSAADHRLPPSRSVTALPQVAQQRLQGFILASRADGTQQGVKKI